VLFSQPDFQMKYVANANQHLSSCKKYSPDCFQCQIQKLALGLSSGKYSQQKLAEKVITDDMTEEQKAEQMKDEYY